MRRRDFIKSLGALYLAEFVFKDQKDKDYDESGIFSEEELDKIVDNIKRSTYPILSKGRTDVWGKGLAYKNYILTNEHLLSEKSYLLYGKELVPLEEYYRDPLSDAAILKYPRIHTKLPKGENFRVELNKIKYKLGDSDKLKVGDYLIMVRSPNLDDGEFLGEGRVVGKRPYGRWKNRKSSFIYDISTTGGDSSSPLIAFYDGKPHIIGIHKGKIVMNDGYRVGEGVKINEYKQYLK